MKDLTGKSFGRLTAQWPAGKRGGKIHWLCLCVCGSFRIVREGNLITGNSHSCGCLQRELATARIVGSNKQSENPHRFVHLRHGHTRAGKKSPEYFSWLAMRLRCTKPKAVGFKNYGGKGITVCERWKSFDNFLADMGPRPKGTTLGRFADIGNYQPGNCAWMTWEQQMAERRKKRLAA